MLFIDQIGKFAGERRNLPNNRGTSCWRGGRQKCPQSDAQVAFLFVFVFFCPFLCLCLCLCLFFIFFVFVFLSWLPNTHHSGQKYPHSNAQVAFSCLCLFCHQSSVITHHLKVTSILWILTVAECSTTVDNSPSRLFMFMHNSSSPFQANHWPPQVGLPAMSGSSGVVMVVVPSVLSFVTWSPPLDSVGQYRQACSTRHQIIAWICFWIYFSNLITQLQILFLITLFYAGNFFVIIVLS